MVKIYVLDTNIFIQSPYAIESFEDNAVVIPLVVLEELDRLKKVEGETGANARKSIRHLESLRNEGNLLNGVRLPNGGTVRIEKNFTDIRLPEDLPDTESDNRILKVCLGLSSGCSEQVVRYYYAGW